MTKTLNLTRQSDSARVEIPDPSSFSIFLATPCYGGMCSTHYLHSVMALQEVCDKLKVGFTIQTLSNESLVQRGRNTLVAQFLRSDATHLFFVDADIGFDPLDVVRLLAAQKPIVAGIYPKKAINWTAIESASSRGETNVQRFRAEYNLNFEFVEKDGRRELPVDGNLLMVKDAATGFMLISRAVFLEMKDKHPEWAYKSNANGAEDEVHHSFFDCYIDASGTYLSEDWAFCRRWQAMGGQIWIDPRIRLTHVGTHPFTAEPIQTFLEYYPVPQAAE